MSASEAVDRLVIIPDDAEISALFREQVEDIPLNTVLLLVFVALNIAETALPPGQDIRVAFEEAQTDEKHVVKIKFFEGLLSFFVRFIDREKCLFLTALRFQRLKIYVVVLDGCDFRCDGKGKLPGVVDAREAFKCAK